MRRAHFAPALFVAFAGALAGALAAVLAAVASARSNAAPVVGTDGRWAVLSNDLYGFSIRYPRDVFQLVPRPDVADGALLESADGRARLLIGTFTNDDRVSLRQYRRTVLERSYDGAALDYAPVRDSWFVVSGTREGEMFYERVSFTCGGSRITSWAMTYPLAERAVYDRLVEDIAPTFRASRSGEGC